MEQFSAEVQQEIDRFMAYIEAKNPNEPEFIQAVREVAVTVIPFILSKISTKDSSYWKEWLNQKE